MAHIHGLQDLEGQQPNNRPFPATGGGGGGYLPPAPSDVRCIDMFLPKFTWRSPILWISFVEVIVYLISLYGSTGMRPNSDVTMKMGAGYGPLIVQGEVWRFVTPIFLHGSIFHILFNVFFQLRMGFPLEFTYGKARMVILYFVSGIAGVSFAVALNFCTPCIGASVAGFGLIGIQLSELALQWHQIQNRDQVILNLVSWLLIVILLSMSPSSNIDWRGHLGGFIAGFSMGIIYNKDMAGGPSWLMTAYSVSIAILVSEYVLTWIFIFFFGKCP